ncbi:hypothetical protein F9U64_10675 [Gracilibacillus oryzae]|uniref:Uncharacterized protein n=1 Tax=Gracilibacillus oryzae TaxID=1672701 RepID=A0A7C8GT75_9BACI|nr:hypothetical protein [Gracilibacillus oryzae]KAB8135731.1 hypothetical protein F9U64_10675 [Gracilibacillus oryzae]
MKKMILILLVCIVMVAFWFYTPKKINRTINGLAYQLGNEEKIERVEIIITGEQRYTLTGKRRFFGTLDIKGEEIPVPQNEREITLNFELGNYSPIYYFYSTRVNGDYTPQIHNYGTIYTNKDLSQLTIMKLKHEGDNGWWNGSEGLMVTAPAQTRKEAMELSDKLIKRYQLREGEFRYIPES